MTDTLPFNKSGGRRLERISHLFLTGRDPETVPPSPPVRPESTVKNTEETTSDDTHAPIYAIVSPEGLISQGALLSCLLARSLATADISVGLVETTVKLPHTFFLSGGYPNIDAVYWEADPRLPEFLHMVARIRSNCELVLINMASSAFSDIDGLGTLTWRYLVPTTIHPDALLNAYAAIKLIATKWRKSIIELVVFKNQPADKAAGAAVILEKMTRRFLTCRVRLAGTIPLTVNHAADASCLSAAFLQRMPEDAAAAAREIAVNFIQSDGLR